MLSSGHVFEGLSFSTFSTMQCKRLATIIQTSYLTAARACETKVTVQYSMIAQHTPHMVVGMKR